MAFFLFILVNATLFLRPADLMPELARFRIYEALILACLAVSLPQIIAYFLERRLLDQPITLGVFSLLVAVVLSLLANGLADEALENGQEFAKLLVFFVLLVAVVNSAARVRQFMLWVMVFATVLTAVAVLRYYEVLDIKTPPPEIAGRSRVPTEGEDGAFIQDASVDPETGETVVFKRLRGTGIFQDPNDLSLVLGLGFLLALYYLLDGNVGPARLLALGPLALFLLAFALTYSRGGLLSLMAGLLTALYARYGWRRMVWLSVACLPPLLYLFAGRMTTMNATEGTGQSRVQIWSDGLVMLRDAPVFGVGMHQYGAHTSHVAHNSFIHCYAELGLIGGTLFLGVFCCALLTLYRIGRTPEAAELSPELRRMQPFLLAVVVAYMVGMLSLSYAYTVPTYLILGLVAAYANVCAAPAAEPVVRVEFRLVQRLAFASVLFLAGAFVFVRVFFRA